MERVKRFLQKKSAYIRAGVKKGATWYSRSRRPEIQGHQSTPHVNRRFFFFFKILLMFVYRA